MAQFVSVTCPNCGQTIQIDPELEVASCGFCSKSSFVQKPGRRVPPDLSGVSVINVAPRRLAPIAIASASLVALGVVAAAFAGLHTRGSASPARLSTPSGTGASSIASSVGSLQAQVPELRPQPAPAEPASSSTSRPPAVEAQGAPKSVGASAAPVAQGRANLRGGTPRVSGHLSPALVQKVVQQSFERFRMCPAQGLSQKAKLAGRVSVRFVVGRDGTVSNVSAAESTLPDAAVTGCVLRAFLGLQFPAPESGIATVVYPLVFSVEN